MILKESQDALSIQRLYPILFWNSVCANHITNNNLSCIGPHTLLEELNLKIVPKIQR